MLMCFVPPMKDPMTCERCGGLSVPRHFDGGQAWEEEGPIWPHRASAGTWSQRTTGDFEREEACARRNQARPTHKNSSVIN